MAAACEEKGCKRAQHEQNMFRMWSTLPITTSHYILTNRAEIADKRQKEYNLSGANVDGAVERELPTKTGLPREFVGSCRRRILANILSQSHHWSK